MNYLEELRKRANLIRSSRLNEFTLRMIDGIPQTIWSMPSSWKHHLLDERGEWGNAIHSIRVTDVSLIEADSLLMVNEPKDALISASLLHDIGKRGLNGDSKIIQTTDHPFLVRKLVESLGYNSTPYDDVLIPIESHMGKWTKGGPLPDFLRLKKLGESSIRVADVSMILHLADCIVARWEEVGEELHAV